VQTVHGARNAIDAGIWSIARSTGLNEEMHTLMAQKGIWRAGTDTPDTLAGHPVSPQAYQRTVASLQDIRQKVPLTFSTDATTWRQARGEVCLEFLKTWKDAAIERRHPAGDDHQRLQVSEIEDARADQAGIRRRPDRGPRQSARRYRHVEAGAVRDEGRPGLQARRRDDAGGLLPRGRSTAGAFVDQICGV
jgi:hypothetical protein